MEAERGPPGVLREHRDHRAVTSFNALSEAEQREVAARLLRIAESGWKPFWCPDPDCDGMPHPLLDDSGDVTYVPVIAVAGPGGEPLSEPVYEDDEGVFIPEEPDQIPAGARPVGRMVLDPKWAHNHARADQRLPGWQKTWTLFIMSGRGSGKTTTGVEFVTLSARRGLDGAIVGRRGTELENTHVATILARAHPEFRPVYWASKDILEWPEVTMADGSKKKPITYLFSAEKPENIRSVNISYAWIDEAAFMDEIATVWMNIKLANRIDVPGNPIHTLVTSTPTSTKWVMDREDDPEIEVRRVSTYANRHNLSPDYLETLRKNYEGTRMGRQELHGEVLRDVEGALWNDEMFSHIHVDEQGYAAMLDAMDDRVLAVDPAGSQGPRSDATGIIGTGAQHSDEDGRRLPRSRFYVLERATLKGSPSEWAAQVFKAARLLRANRIVAEKNFGGDMVKQVLSDYAALHPDTTKDENGEDFRIIVKHAVKSKEIRAEGTVGKYEQGCIDGEALVPTHRGVVPLREVSRGDYVLTRFGLRRVTNALDQGIRDVVEVITTEGSLVMTDDHEVCTSNRGWVHACDLVPTDTVIAWERYASTAGQLQRAVSQSRDVTPARPSTCGSPATRSESFRSIREFATTSRKTGTGGQGGTAEDNSCTGPFGKASAGLFQQGGTFITRIMTRVTTEWRTLSQSHRESIRLITILRVAAITSGSTALRSLRGVLGQRRAGSKPTRIWSVKSAALRFDLSCRTPDSASPPVIRDGGIVSVRGAGKRHVFDLSVEEHPEFFANGILVHNCVFHVASPTLFGDLSELEKQQIGWVPKSRGGKGPSPNDVDALVWGIRELETGAKHVTSVASSKAVLAQLHRGVSRLGHPGHAA